jgi:hypothetical protein
MERSPRAWRPRLARRPARVVPEIVDGGDVSLREVVPAYIEWMIVWPGTLVPKLWIDNRIDVAPATAAIHERSGSKRVDRAMGPTRSYSMTDIGH